MRAYDELRFFDADCGLGEVPYGTNALQQRSCFHVAENRRAPLARRKHFSFSVIVERHSSTNGSLIRPEADQ
jgi:hypothetical protein